MNRKALLVCTLAALCGCVTQSPEPETLDVCVFGGTSGGIAAAIQAKRMGKSVVLLEPGKYLGGLTTGGLGATDIGNKAAIGGISREFYARVARHYAKEESWTLETRQEYFAKRGSGQARASDLSASDATMWTFEPHVADRVFHEMLAEADVPYEFGQRLAKVRKNGLSIREITTSSGHRYRARMFIDATYEGDLMAKADVSFTVGREANRNYGETLNGIRAQTPHHQFTVPVDPYEKRGEPNSGLLPFIQPGEGGQPGEGDPRVQAYNYRLCFTTNAANRLPVEPPADYDPAQFELLARYLEALVAAGKQPRLAQFWNPIWMPNQKTDINNNGGFSTDFIGMNYEYPNADYEKRERIAKAHENYTRGFITFLATSPRVPENMRQEMRQWGPAKDEFRDTDGWPRQLYVREARRMVADYVMTEKHCRYQKTATDSVGLAAYNMDSHNCQRIVKNGRVENEGDVQVAPMKPYPISYQAIVPKAAECDNLFVPVCLSATHIAYGSIRMEPVFMILGQSAATAACLAIEDNVAVQRLDYRRLRERLLADRQTLDWQGPAGSGSRAPIHKLEGVVIDDLEARREGEWNTGNSLPFLAGSGYSHDGDAHKGQLTLTFMPKVPTPGVYEVILHWPPAGNRSARVPVLVRLGTEEKSFHADQKNEGTLTLGKYQLGGEIPFMVQVSNSGTTGHVVVDALQLLRR